MKTFLSIVLAVALLSACQNSAKKSGNGGSSVRLTAAGATFPLPYYNLVFKNYTKETGVLVSYGGIGSGGGIRSLKDKVVDFGATDAYLTDAQLSEMQDEVVHIPTCIGAVVIAYNLPGVGELKLSDQLLEQIFMGEITNTRNRHTTTVQRSRLWEQLNSSTGWSVTRPRQKQQRLYS